MPADKQINRDKLPEPEKENKKQRHQEEFDDKSKEIKEKMKSRNVKYVVRDLPIY
jgi:hypothetical protein